MCQDDSPNHLQRWQRRGRAPPELQLQSHQLPTFPQNRSKTTAGPRRSARLQTLQNTQWQPSKTITVAEFLEWRKNNPLEVCPKLLNFTKETRTQAHTKRLRRGLRPPPCEDTAFNLSMTSLSPAKAVAKPRTRHCPVAQNQRPFPPLKFTWYRPPSMLSPESSPGPSLPQNKQLTGVDYLDIEEELPNIRVQQSRCSSPPAESSDIPHEMPSSIDELEFWQEDEELPWEVELDAIADTNASSEAYGQVSQNITGKRPSATVHSAAAPTRSPTSLLGLTLTQYLLELVAQPTPATHSPRKKWSERKKRRQARAREYSPTASGNHTQAADQVA